MSFCRALSVVWVLIASVCIGTPGYSGEPSKSQCAHLKGMVKYNHGFYNAGQNQIKFFMGFAFPADWRNELEINQIAEGLAKNYSGCHAAYTWRWEILPEDHPSVLILTWHNMSNGHFGWCAIKNTDEYWYVSSNYSPWRVTRSVVTPFQWNSNGSIITIQYRNPENENGWTEHDIWSSFGF